ncbi:hypothetical protein BC835DRAFT_490448 [Cytidiella melzeri]|nr:hypothetical protein BC835DRAFT_490448 [Cytidiella melzeri]
MQLSPSLVLLTTILSSTVNTVTVSAAQYSQREPYHPISSSNFNSGKRWVVPSRFGTTLGIAGSNYAVPAAPHTHDRRFQGNVAGLHHEVLVQSLEEQDQAYWEREAAKSLKNIEALKKQALGEDTKSELLGSAHQLHEVEQKLVNTYKEKNGGSRKLPLRQQTFP